jgi:hypothetical protein
VGISNISDTINFANPRVFTRKKRALALSQKLQITLLNSIGSFLLTGTLVAAQTINIKTLAAESGKDSITPSQKDGIVLMQSICGQSNVFIDRKQEDKVDKVSCKTCPSFTGSSGEPGGVLTSVVYGSFTSSSSREALVDVNGCELHAQNWGGSALLRRSNSGWSFIRYEKGLRSNRCLKLREQNGRNSLVCEGSWMGQGYLSQWLEAVKISSTQTITTTLLNVASNAGSGKPPFYDVGIENFSLRDVNKDGLPDLVIKVSEAREAKGTTRPKNSPYEARLPKPTIHQLTFLFNGQFRPTPETVKLKQRLERK